MAVVLSSLQALQSRADGVIGVLAVIFVLMAIRPLVSRLWIPRDAPQFLKQYYGFRSPTFSYSRAAYLEQGKHQTPDGQFSFWHGANHIVAVSGHTARATYLTSRGLDSLAGFLALLGGFLNVDGLTNSYVRLLMLVYKRCTQDEHMTENLHHLINDSHESLKDLGSKPSIDPVDFMASLVYQLTHRMVGTHDIAKSKKLVDSTREIYKPLEESSLFDIWFPLLPTLSKLNKLWGYSRLHWMIQGFVSNRRKTGQVQQDAMQLMIDQGCSSPMISLAIIGAILAGVFNTSINAAWNLCHLAKDPVWMAKLQSEVDAVIRNHRQSKTEDIADILQRLTLKEWETEFPLLELTIHETLRFTMSGTIVRRNIGNKDVPLGDTGSFIPKNSLAVYSSADAHMNPDVYKDPLKWDPSRHDKDRAEGSQIPHSFLGWGSGNHPCPAMRFAKLNIVVPTVMFIAYYDFHMCDVEGDATKGPLPDLMFDRVGAGRPSEQVYMRCKPRV
ncbi:cytochrome P450 [Dactylonectria estremocensis]|uniref:Cytochrome P450 n=1 Tax=Dactylonectria estremocensis TaxID=1079267 RepID=A0A9P9DPC8_9HYPO|nr:cytochrome P450 [Dactylonectria estremocensis]